MAYIRHNANCQPVPAENIKPYKAHDAQNRPRADRKRFKRHNQDNQPVEPLAPVRVLKNPTIKYVTHNTVPNARVRGSKGTFQGGSGEYKIEIMIQRRDVGSELDWVGCTPYKTNKNLTYTRTATDDGKEHRVISRCTDLQTQETEYSYSPTITLF